MKKNLIDKINMHYYQNFFLLRFRIFKIVQYFKMTIVNYFRFHLKMVNNVVKHLLLLISAYQ